jgi:YYY domain-containing protein
MELDPVLIALRWYLALQVFGLAALPLTLRLFRHLPGRGYAFARPLGLLVGGWLFWLLLIFGWLPNSASAVLVVLALLLIAGSALRTTSRSEAASAAQPLDWRHVLVTELLFAAAFAGWCLVRAHMPRIETAGGEKWMEIAFLNAIVRAPRFPPHDPWLSGYAISYYYFGYVMMGMLIKLSAMPTTIAFNLGIASLFALTCSGAYGLAYALLARRGEQAALGGALLAPLMLALTGNLEGLLEVFHARGLFPAAFWEWLDIRSINVPPPPFASGSWMPQRFIWWWQASRVLHDTAPWHTAANPAEWEVIDEFPAFSFLLGDMHPHLLSLPFVLLALALAMALLLRPAQDDERRWLPLPPWELFLYPLCLGGLGFLNTWDFPIYLFVAVVAFAIALLSRQPQPTWRCALRVLSFALVLALGGVLLYLPFWVGLRSQASGILPNLFNPTRLPQFLVMFGPFLLPIAAWVIARARQERVPAVDVAIWSMGTLLLLLLFVLMVVFVTPTGRQYLDAWRSGGPIPGLEHIPDAPQLIARRLQQRALNPWTALTLSALLGTAGLALLSMARPRPSAAAPDRPFDPRSAFLLLLVVTGALLTLSVEFVYLRDIFGVRMNTVFKFYFQAWVLWSVAATCALTSLLERRDLPGLVLAGLSLLLVLGGMVYLPLAISSRARESGGEPTLDGAAYLYRSQAYDFAAIDWLNENVTGAPVILEAPGDHYRAYVYEGRVSAFTGLPTLLGWSGHQHQWRGDYDEPARREPDIEELYSTTDLARTVELLEQYNIRYVYVGPLERERYPAASLARFDLLLERVYQNAAVSIYLYRGQRLQTSAPPASPIPPQAQPE